MKVGDRVNKIKGYQFPSTVRAVFTTSKGETRIVAEMEGYGLLHIFNEQQLFPIPLREAASPTEECCALCTEYLRRWGCNNPACPNCHQKEQPYCKKCGHPKNMGKTSRCEDAFHFEEQPKECRTFKETGGNFCNPDEHPNKPKVITKLDEGSWVDPRRESTELRAKINELVDALSALTKSQ